MKVVASHRRPILLFTLALYVFTNILHSAAPVVSNVRASQRPGSKLVDIFYDLSDPDSSAITIFIQISADGGATWTVPARSFSGAQGGGVTPGVNKYVVWNAGADWDGQFTTNCRVKISANDADPQGFALIPAGSFTMGDPFAEGYTDERPLHSVYVSAFYIEKAEVSKSLWDSVYQWAVTRGYTFDNAGGGKAADHPVHGVNWFDAVKWCNARSQVDGLTPVYYTDATLTNVYKTGQRVLYVKWNANGYRLPTEAEWEKAARGGLNGSRFPWGDIITHNLANYFSQYVFTYDASPTRDYHPTYNTGSFPYTSPVASFPPNGYGLYDMAGNVAEWCWDWYDSGWYSNSGATQADPKGPTTTGYRVHRGGSWYSAANIARCAFRGSVAPSFVATDLGFRCVKGF
ncbi:MAG: formylglycine-generating enzyme family protein [Verrucomicrobiae bacterium]|nr:formylglycine-generating enzyme family protein [Verrucomicrobiae bacterium]